MALQKQVTHISCLLVKEVNDSITWGVCCPTKPWAGLLQIQQSQEGNIKTSGLVKLLLLCQLLSVNLLARTANSSLLFPFCFNFNNLFVKKRNKIHHYILKSIIPRFHTSFSVPWTRLPLCPRPLFPLDAQTSLTNVLFPQPS